MLAGCEDYAHWSRRLYSLVERTIFVFKFFGIGRRTVLSQATNRTFASDKTALCGRRNGTLRATKRTFVSSLLSVSYRGKIGRWDWLRPSLRNPVELTASIPVGWRQPSYESKWVSKDLKVNFPSSKTHFLSWSRWDSNPRPSEPESDALFS